MWNRSGQGDGDGGSELGRVRSEVEAAEGGRGWRRRSGPGCGLRMTAPRRDQLQRPLRGEARLRVRLRGRACAWREKPVVPGLASPLATSSASIMTRASPGGVGFRHRRRRGQRGRERGPTSCACRPLVGTDTAREDPHAHHGGSVPMDLRSAPHGYTGARRRSGAGGGCRWPAPLVLVDPSRPRIIFQPDAKGILNSQPRT